MKLSKKLQYGLLLVLYISRGGRVTIEGAAEGLGLSRPFLEQVARLLRISGVIKSVRGPNGGYELAGEPTVNDVFNSLSPVKLLDKSELFAYGIGVPPEHRALSAYVSNMQASLAPVLNRKIKNLMAELVANEMAHMDRIQADSTIN